MKTIRLTKLLKLVLIVLLSVPLNNCSLFDPITPEDDVVEKTITSDGGSIENQTVEIVIPAGAFNESHTIEVSKTDPQSTNFGDDEASVFYKISGIPLNINAPIQIKIEPEGGNLDQMLGIVGETVYLTSMDKEQLVYRFHEGEITGNQYQMVLEPEPENQQQNNEAIDINVGLIQHHQILPVSPTKESTEKNQTEQILFEMVVNDEYVAQATLLADYLLEAYYKIQDQLGFDYSARTKWPVTVTFSDLGSEAYGYYNPSKWKTNWGTISLNERKLNEPAMMRVTIGHEFFHLVQALYDPRYNYTKATSAGPWWWVDEATATWIEEKFSESQDYSPPIWADNKLTSMTGLLDAETGSTLGQHGYGMAAFIKFIEKNYGIDKIRKLYEYYWNFQSSPLEAINSVLNSNPGAYYPEYVKQYVLSQLYKDFTYKDFSTDWNHVVRNEDDYNKTLKINYPALSTRLLAVKFQDTNLIENSYMEIEQKSNSESTTMLLFKTQNEVTSFIAQNPNKITLNNLQQIQQENSKLWLFIINYQNQPLTNEEHIVTIHNTPAGDCPPEGVQIGNQCWMKENLNIEVGNSRCWYDDPQWCLTYGRLYDWNTALIACPDGWHLPSKNEWSELVDFIISQGYPNSYDSINGAGNALKSCKQIDSPLGGGCNTIMHPRWNKDGWTGNNHFGFDAFGFAGLPGGEGKPTTSSFVDTGLGEIGVWWTSDAELGATRSIVLLKYYSGYIHHFESKGKDYFLSVRCLKTNGN